MEQESSENLVKNLQAKARRLQSKLSPNQAIFADQYIASRNATQSYLIAYPKCKSEKSAAELGSRLLRNVKVQAYKDCRLEIMREKTLIKPENLLREESKIIFRDIRQLFDGETLISPDQIPDEVASVIDSVEIKSRRVKDGDDWTTEYTYKYKLSDKGAALGRMERHLGMYTDKVDLNPDGRTLKIEDMTKNEIARRIAFTLSTALRNKEKENATK
jgi:phage terminase small subunit